MPAWSGQTVRLTRCPMCDYDLSALPRRHRCPECGFGYDQSMFLLEGWKLPDARGAVRLLKAAAPAVLFGAAFIKIGLGVSWLRLLELLMAVGLLAAILYIYASWRDRSGRRVLVRYLITEDGVARPGGHVYLWRNYSHTALLPDGHGGWRLHLYPSWWRPVGPPMVNARLECSESEAQALRAEIHRRINAARSREAEPPDTTRVPPQWGR